LIVATSLASNPPTAGVNVESSLIVPLEIII
jgi:hypothetical protein